MSRARYGQGSGPIFLDDVQCRGNESKISECRSDGIAVHNCGHSEDAGAICKREETDSTTCSLFCRKDLSCGYDKPSFNATLRYGHTYWYSLANNNEEIGTHLYAAEF